MYTHILHATDLSENHFQMAQTAVKIAEAFQAKLHLLYVIEPPVSLQLAQGLGFAEIQPPEKDSAVGVMKILGEALDIPMDQQWVEVGSVRAHVLEKANQLGCRLIILGRHKPGKLPAFLGSTAHEIVKEARCDVLTLDS